MSAPKAILAFLVGRPLIAIAIAAAVVGVLLLVQTHRQKTPVTHRVQHVALTDEQQMRLGSQEYVKTLRANRANVIASGSKYAQVQRVASRIEAVAARDKARLRLEGDTASQERRQCLLLARREDRRLLGHLAADQERRGTGDRARA